MAAYPHPRAPVANYGGGYPRNEFKNSMGHTKGPHAMPNFGDHGSVGVRSPYGYIPFASMPRPMNYPGRSQFSGGYESMRPPLRFQPNMGLRPNRMPQPGPMYQQPFQAGGGYPNSGATSGMRMPSMPSQQYFSPWNQRPALYHNPRMPGQGNSAPMYNPKYGPASNMYGDHPPRYNGMNRNQREESWRAKPWMTVEIYDEIKKKNDLYNLAKKNNSPELWQQFKLVRNQVGTLIKEAKVKGGFLVRKEDGAKLYSCDTCDRAYSEEVHLKNHIREHVQCDYEGCNFRAHSKIVAMHKKTLHETGYAVSISKLRDSEEIQKWRDERRSRFPTYENIMKRQAEQAEKVERGEVIETQQFGKFKRPRLENSEPARCDDWQNQGRRRRRRPRQRERNMKEPRYPVRGSEAPDSDSDTDSHIKLPAFPGISVSIPIDAMSCSSQTSADLPSCDVNMDVGISDQNDNDVPFVSESVESSDVPLEMQLYKSKNCELEDLNPSALPVQKSMPNEPFHPEGPLENNNTVMETTASENNKKSEDESLSVIPVQKSVTVEKIHLECPLQTNNMEVETAANEDNNESEDDGPSVMPIQKSVANDLEPLLPNDMDLETAASGSNNDLEDDGPVVLTIVKSTSKEEPHSDVVKLPKPSDIGKESPGNRVSDGCKRSDSKQRVSRSSAVRQESKDAGLRKVIDSRTWPTGLKKNNLLDKLLANDIRHERNTIMQCIRYIVNNNFFGRR